MIRSMDYDQKDQFGISLSRKIGMSRFSHKQQVAPTGSQLPDNDNELNWILEIMLEIVL